MVCKMKSFYISTNTIVKAYHKLTSVEVNDPSVFHIFLILKGCGYDSLSFRPVQNIADLGIPVAYNLSGLFTPIETPPAKYEFINPLSMKSFAAQAPSESLKKWVSSRIKNNIIGGATTWRKIINENIYNNEIRFSSNYAEEIKNHCIPNNNINSIALAIWYYRMYMFDKKITTSDLVSSFYKELSMEENEISLFFESEPFTDISFIDSIHDASKIRALIGAHKNYNANWVESVINDDFADKNYSEISPKTHFVMETNYKAPSVQRIFNVLKNNYQVILSGPPGTSKSFLAGQVANAIEKKYSSNNVLKIQFHPQYSYQDFIGGFIVNIDKVEFNEGVLLAFAKDAIIGKDELFLLVIDEINRANVSKVFGEVTQCLDRNYETTLKLGGRERSFSLPKNLLIIATMNTADRTIGSLDFALRRRFSNIYCPVNESELIDLCSMENNFSLSDMLSKINNSLKKVLHNNELVVGQTIFYNDSFFIDGKYTWDFEKLEDLFNFRILPIIEEYTFGDANSIKEIVGEQLYKRLSGQEFINELIDFTSS